MAEYDDTTNTTSVANHIVYDAFGSKQTETNAAIDTLFGYTGRAFDEETGLQNNLNRWYDSTTGRWISDDPIGFAAGDANLYRYVGNSPTDLIDPTGNVGVTLSRKKPTSKIQVADLAGNTWIIGLSAAYEHTTIFGGSGNWVKGCPWSTLTIRVTYIPSKAAKTTCGVVRLGTVKTTRPIHWSMKGHENASSHDRAIITRNGRHWSVDHGSSQPLSERADKDVFPKRRPGAVGMNPDRGRQSIDYSSGTINISPLIIPDAMNEQQIHVEPKRPVNQILIIAAAEFRGKKSGTIVSYRPIKVLAHVTPTGTCKWRIGQRIPSNANATFDQALSAYNKEADRPLGTVR